MTAYDQWKLSTPEYDSPDDEGDSNTRDDFEADQMEDRAEYERDNGWEP